MKENHILKKYGRIRWQDDYETDCTYTWYESKNELRITGFGRGRSPLSAEFTGALFVLVKDSEVDYQGFLLNTDDDIGQFLDTFGLTPAETNRPIEVNRVNPEIREKQAIDTFIEGLQIDFPSSSEMSQAARIIQYDVYMNRQLAVTDPDTILLRWTDEEYTLFRALEHARYGGTVARGFASVDDFIVHFFKNVGKGFTAGIGAAGDERGEVDVVGAAYNIVLIPHGTRGVCGVLCRAVLGLG